MAPRGPEWAEYFREDSGYEAVFALNLIGSGPGLSIPDAIPFQRLTLARSLQ